MLLVQEPTQAAIWHCLNHYAFNDAVFLAERLHAEVGSDDSLFLLATCYYRSNKRNQTYSTLKSYPKPLSYKNRYLLAQCCLDLNRLSESEQLLIDHPQTSESTIDTITSNFADTSAFALKLHGKICQQTDRVKLARNSYIKSLKLNPFLWDSFINICNLEEDDSENVDPKDVFQVAHLDNFTLCHGTPNLYNVNHQEQQVSGVNAGDVIHPKYNSTPIQQRSTKGGKAIPYNEDLHNAVLQQTNKTTRPNKFRNLFTSTPMSSSMTFGLLPLEISSDLSYGANLSFNSSFIMVQSPGGIGGLGCVTGGQDVEPRSKKPCLRVPAWQQQQLQPIQMAHSPSTTQQSPQQQQPLNQQTANVRRSSRLFSNSNVSVKENSKTPTRPRLTPSKSPNRKGNKIRTPKSTTPNNNNSTWSENQKNTVEEVEEDSSTHFLPPTITGTPTSNLCSPCPPQQVTNMMKQSAEGLMCLFRELGKCYLHLARFECRETVEGLTSLKSAQYNTGWVLGLIGKAFFEMGDYEESIKFYTKMRAEDPHRLDGLDTLSTAFWHLQREVDLSALSHDLLSTDKSHPATWICVGNCFSINKEHETSIKFFKRAIQINPNHEYSYTLLGHEYVATGEYEKAMRCFRNAVRINPRHYNAWYGMGMIYYKQERYTKAEVYYNKAIKIHPSNSILLCHLGVVQQAMNQIEKSLETFSKALERTPKDPLCKFHRASVLFIINKLDEALVELEELKQICPRESLVYFLIAKVYTKKGDTHKALLHFSWATDLDPKGSNNQIKESIEPILLKTSTLSINQRSRPGEEEEDDDDDVEEDESHANPIEESGSDLTL